MEQSRVRESLYNIHVCPICGKEFNCYCPDEWAYKIRTYTGSRDEYERVCSYPCMRKWQREHKEEDYD